MEKSEAGIPDMEMIIKPVGVVKSDIKSPTNRAKMAEGTLREGLEASARERRKIRSLVSELVIDPDLEGILEGIDDFSHIMVLFWPHLLPPESRRRRQGHPLGLPDMPLVGIFSTRSPARPNPVLVSVVRLLERNGNVLKVEGFEAVDGTPIVDIKPYYPATKENETIRVSDWMKLVHESMEDTDE